MACPSSSPSMPASPRQGEARLGGVLERKASSADRSAPERSSHISHIIHSDPTTPKLPVRSEVN